MGFTLRRDLHGKSERKKTYFNITKNIVYQRRRNPTEDFIRPSNQLTVPVCTMSIKESGDGFLRALPEMELGDSRVDLLSSMSIHVQKNYCDIHGDEEKSWIHKYYHKWRQ